MENIKLVSWDVYGTLIATHYDESTDCGDIPLRLRPGALEVLSEIKLRGITQCTSSDGHLGNLKTNLKEAGVEWTNFFYDLYKMGPYQQKDFSYIMEAHQIKPKNLLVIGDNYDIDIALAKKQGCITLHVPEENFKPNPLNVIAILKLLK